MHGFKFSFFASSSGKTISACLISNYLLIHVAAFRKLGMSSASFFFSFFFICFHFHPNQHCVSLASEGAPWQRPCSIYILPYYSMPETNIVCSNVAQQEYQDVQLHLVGSQESFLVIQTHNSLRVYITYLYIFVKYKQAWAAKILQMTAVLTPQTVMV